VGGSGKFLEFIGSLGEVIEKKWRAGVGCWLLVVGCCMDQGVKSRISVFLFTCKECLLNRKNSSRKPYGCFDVCVFDLVQKVVVGTICVFFVFVQFFCIMLLSFIKLEITT